MRVFLTGASGFVGSHTVRALLDAGHRPRALVRDQAKAAKVLANLGVPEGEVEFVTGDMLDPGAVNAALDGCDAAIHAAAAIGVTGAPTRPRGPLTAGAASGRDPESALVQVNVSGTRNVVGGAVARGLDRVIHVSTVAVFVPPGGPRITTDGPLATPRTEYGRSKLAAERYVRDLQKEGAPVTIVYPGGVCGPDQPVLDALMEGLSAALDQAWPLPPGGVSVIDVRDLGEALTRAVATPTPDRLLLGGHYLTWPQYADLCDRLTGLRCRRVRVPAAVMLGAGTALDAAKRIRNFDYPLTRDAAEFMVKLVPTDDGPSLDALSMTLRPIDETVSDGLRWLAETGHLRRAGRLAPSPAPDAPKEPPVPTFIERAFGPTFQKVSGARWFSKVGPKVVPPLDRALHKVTGGRFLLGQLLVPSLVLTTTGAISGKRRQTPLACMPEPDGSFIVVGSNFGREKHPAWTGNLIKNPGAEVSHRGRTAKVTARLIEGEERAKVWPRLIQVWPVYDRYVERVDRELRVFRLTPVS
ncbi:nitroreductase/quinone reductase family protein [Actinomadura sp. 9N407]|uniref:nitroreductase/quinone reductase family protein n=1 Tax=Actinomadura sp. 9N407 TaxID=3375154 RepID=UPI0037B48B61